MKYENERVIVAGGASGLGLSLVRKLLEKKAFVYILDVNETRLAVLQDEMKEFDNSFCCMQADASDAEQVESVFQTIYEQGPVTMMISCIGTALISPFEKITRQQWDRVVAVNLTGTFNLLQAAVPHMLANGSGTIVVISSESGVLASPYCCGYAATKYGIIGMCDSLRFELADRGIRVMTVCPGEFRSNLGETSMQMGTMAFDAKNAGMEPDYVADEIVKALDTDTGLLMVTKPDLLPLLSRDFRYFVAPSEETIAFEMKKSRDRAKRLG